MLILEYRKLKFSEFGLRIVDINLWLNLEQFEIIQNQGKDYCNAMQLNKSEKYLFHISTGTRLISINYKHCNHLINAK